MIAKGLDLAIYLAHMSVISSIIWSWLFKRLRQKFEAGYLVNSKNLPVRNVTRTTKAADLISTKQLISACPEPISMRFYNPLSSVIPKRELKFLVYGFTDHIFHGLYPRRSCNTDHIRRQISKNSVNWPFEIQWFDDKLFSLLK